MATFSSATLKFARLLVSPNIARECLVRANKCMDALANSKATRRRLEPMVCVGTMGPTQKLWAIRKQARDGLFPPIFHGEHSELREKYGSVNPALFIFEKNE